MKSAQIGWSLLALMRFLLASIVAIAHTTDFERSPLSMFAISLDAKAAVVGFLVISGFSIAASLDRNQNGFYFRRFKRIYPIYFFAVLLGIALELWLGHLRLPYYNFEPGGPISAIGSLLMLQTFLVKSIPFNPIIWSLAAESAFYVLSPFIWKRSYLLCILCGISIAFYVLPFGEHGLLYTAMLKANAVKYFWPFGFGVLLYRHNMPASYAICLALGAATVTISPINFGVYAVATYTATIAAIWAARHYPSRSRVMDYLGDLSYPLYLLQFPVFVVLYVAFGTTSVPVLFIGALAVSLVAFETIEVRLKPLLFERTKPATYGPILNDWKP